MKKDVLASRVALYYGERWRKGIVVEMDTGARNAKRFLPHSPTLALL
jgi:hypothetical protein